MGAAEATAHDRHDHYAAGAPHGLSQSASTAMAINTWAGRREKIGEIADYNLGLGAKLVSHC